MDLNPCRNSLVREIENLAQQNLQKVGGQEIPQFKSDIVGQQTKTVESLIDCSFVDQIRDEIMKSLPEDSQKVLMKLTENSSIKDLDKMGRGQSFLYQKSIKVGENVLNPDFMFRVD